VDFEPRNAKQLTASSRAKQLSGPNLGQFTYPQRM